MQVISNMVLSLKADMKAVGGSSQSGVLVINKKISNADEFVLIHQSVTGLYQAEVNLLTV